MRNEIEIRIRISFFFRMDDTTLSVFTCKVLEVPRNSIRRQTIFYVTYKGGSQQTRSGPEIYEIYEIYKEIYEISDF